LLSDAQRLPEVLLPLFDYGWMKEKYAWARP